MEILKELEWQLKKIVDVRAPQNFQIHDPCYTFQVPPQQEEPMGLDESMENLIQAGNYVTQSINRIEA